MVGRPSFSAGYQPSWHLRNCLSPQVWGYRSLISAGFRSVWPEISTSPVLHDL